MRLLISDANILIDMEAGALMGTLFQLPMQFGIPDLLLVGDNSQIGVTRQQGADLLLRKCQS